jgi:hypothetical protein
MAKTTSKKANAPTQEQAKARRKAAQNTNINTVEQYKEIHEPVEIEPEPEPEVEVTVIVSPEISEVEPEVIIDRENVSDEVKVMSLTPFQTLETKVGKGKVETVLGYFPLVGTDKGLVFRNKDGSMQEQAYSINRNNLTSLFSLFVYKLPTGSTKKGGKYASAELTKAFTVGGYAGLANLVNEMNEVAIRNFDRTPVLFRIANGEFDDGLYSNEIVGALMTYNELPHEKLVQLIQDGNIANLVTHSFLFPESLDVFFNLRNRLPTDLGMQMYGRIQNGSSGTISFNFNGVIRSKNGKYTYILPQVDENGNYIKMNGRNRHMGWLENGVSAFVEAVEKISQINYVETLQAITFDNVWRLFETARTILINDKKPMDAEKSEITLGTLKTRCKMAGFTTGLQVFNEATLLAELHGNGKYLNPMLDKVFDLIFGQ